METVVVLMGRCGRRTPLRGLNGHSKRKRNRRPPDWLKAFLYCRYALPHPAGSAPAGSLCSAECTRGSDGADDGSGC